jgi:hypothetical protein
VVAETLPPWAAIRALNAVDEFLPELALGVAWPLALGAAKKAVHSPKVAWPFAIPPTGPAPVAVAVEGVDPVVSVVVVVVVVVEVEVVVVVGR